MEYYLRCLRGYNAVGLPMFQKDQTLTEEEYKKARKIYNAEYQKIYQRNRRRESPEYRLQQQSKSKEYNKQFRQKNPDKMREYKRRAYEKNKEKYRKHARDYYHRKKVAKVEKICFTKRENRLVKRKIARLGRG